MEQKVDTFIKWERIKEVEQMVKIALETDKLPKLDDTVDAIAIAICHSRSC